MNAATLSGPDATKTMTPAMRASRVLGWVSFALGAAELIAPRKVARAVGMDEERTGLLRAYGAREVVAGIGAHSVNPVPAMWSRVAGDLIDVGTIVLAARRNDEGGRDKRVWIAVAAVAGITLLDALVASQLAAERKEGKGEAKDYGDRSGFPKGAEAARGAGIAKGAYGGKAGGAAAGDVSPAGEGMSGRTSTDLAGAAKSDQRSAETVGGSAPGSGTSEQGASGIKGGQTMPPESQAVVPQGVGYTPA